ncbi:hypothetical protein KH5_12870 [Urechidicola sp. KH5]
MTISTKIKIGILFSSIFIIAFIVLFDNSFYKKETTTEWNEISWSNFKGMPKPFSRFSAQIYTEIKVEYDSINKKYNSKAVQINNKSWHDSKVKESVYLLKHEQYHFNITEYYSRFLNNYLKKTEPKSESEFKTTLDSIILENIKMQRLYDTETEHSANVQEQLNWENRIDSLLKEESNNKYFTQELLTKGRYNKRWVNLNKKDSISAKVELYISENNDSIWNQILLYRNNKIDTLNSRFYNLSINNSSSKNIYHGKLELFSFYNDSTLQNSKNRFIRFTYLEQNRDSIWISNVTSESIEQLEFSFENYYNNKIHGIVIESIQKDTITFHMDSIYKRYILIDNKLKTSDIFINNFDLKEENELFF